MKNRDQITTHRYEDIETGASTETAITTATSIGALVEETMISVTAKKNLFAPHHRWFEQSTSVDIAGWENHLRAVTVRMLYSQRIFCAIHELDN
jgi:hypothetical protein